MIHLSAGVKCKYWAQYGSYSLYGLCLYVSSPAVLLNLSRSQLLSVLSRVVAKSKFKGLSVVFV